MKKILSIVLLALFLAQLAAPAALAMHSEPIADCPPGFELMMVMEGEDHEGHMHQHIGTSVDQNGDHWICMRHLPGDNHLHVDNTVPFE